MKMVNTEAQDVSALTEEMKERRALPIGRMAFEEWSERIIKGSLVYAENDSLKFSLAAMLMHLGPTEAFKEDGFFILQLRKAAVNQTAHSMMEEMKEAQKKKQAEATAPTLEVVNDGSILENKGL